jgi:hypothetical protein
MVRFAAGAVSLLAALVAAETATRIIDGFSLRSTRLVRVGAGLVPSTDSGKWVDPQQAREYVARLPVAAGVTRDWFALDPDKPPVHPIDPELERRYWSTRDHELPSVYEWNLEFVRRVICTGDASAYPYLAGQFRQLKDAFVFEPPDGAPYPTYRFLRNARYPSGLTTNSFGWRGPEVPLHKPRGRIRVAFVGASTTLDAHGDPFSYPEYVGRWLREWAERIHRDVSFDVINAGREGVLSNSIAAIVRDEVLPLTPDLVVYYEGANQFWPNDFVARPVARALRLFGPGSVLETHSALGARIRNLLDRPADGAEPRKPALSVSWPADLDEHDPPLGDQRLPVQLPRILRDLETIRAATSSAGGTLIPSSFVWLVSDGLILDADRDAIVYRELNQRYWPFSYAHMRRFVDFENRVFRKYAQVHGLPFNDLATEYPADPRLFVDSIHMTPAGVKLKAWLVFQHLVPVIEQRLRTGTLPSSDPNASQAHPAFTDAGRRLLPIAQIAARCG